MSLSRAMRFMLFYTTPAMFRIFRRRLKMIGMAARTKLFWPTNCKSSTRLRRLLQHTTQLPGMSDSTSLRSN